MALQDKANARERGHIAAISAWADGDWAGYKQRLDLVSAEHPRDLLAIQAGHLADFYHGDRENLRDRIARALPSWTADMPGYSYVLGMLAYAASGRADDADRLLAEVERQATAHPGRGGAPGRADGAGDRAAAGAGVPEAGLPVQLGLAAAGPRERHRAQGRVSPVAAGRTPRAHPAAAIQIANRATGGPSAPSRWRRDG